jgi:hypothetical protein
MRRILYLRQCVRCTSCASSDRRTRKRSLGGVVTWIRDNDSRGSYCRISPVQELHNLSEQRMRISRSSFESFSGSFMSSPQIIGLKAWFSSPSIERVISATVPEGIELSIHTTKRALRALSSVARIHLYGRVRVVGCPLVLISQTCVQLLLPQDKAL